MTDIASRVTVIPNYESIITFHIMISKVCHNSYYKLAKHTVIKLSTILCTLNNGFCKSATPVFHVQNIDKVAGLVIMHLLQTSS